MLPQTMTPQERLHRNGFSAHWKGEWEERASVMEFCGNMSRDEAESAADWDVIRVENWPRMYGKIAENEALNGVFFNRGMKSPKPPI